MNILVIMNMVSPYVKESKITYNDFNSLFSMLSDSERDEISNILFEHGIVVEKTDEAIYCSMAQDYVIDGYLFYEDFDKIYEKYPLRKQYEIVEILFSAGIELRDQFEESIVIESMDLESLVDPKNISSEEKANEKNTENVKVIQEKTYKKKSLLKPKNDIVFQTLFTRGSESITKAMLEDILNIKINKINLDKSKDLLNDNIRNKNGRLDIRAILNGNIDCDIEMQLVPHEKMVERFLYYWSKMYAANLKGGEDYRELKKAISIIIIDAEIPILKKIPKAHTEWEIREKKFQEVVLTDHFEMHIISLPEAVKEYNDNKKDEVLQWMIFIDNPENVEVSKIMEENKDIKEANKRLMEISQDEALRRQALNEEIARLDEGQRLYDATQKGLKQGREEGRKEAREEKIKIINKLSSMGMTDSDISEAVGISEQEIRKILNKK